MLAHCAVCIVTYTQEKRVASLYCVRCYVNVLAHCAVCIVMEAEANKESSIQILIQIGFRDGDDQYKLRPGHSVWNRSLGPSTQ